MPKITIQVGERVVAVIDVSDDVAREMAVDIVANPLELMSKDEKAKEERMKLSKALIESAKKS